MGEKGKRGSSARKKGVSERIEDWDVKESTVERLLDIMIALIALCIILCWGFVTLSVRQHILTMILVPLLIYFTLSFSGMRLRMRERLSWLLFTDILAVVNVIVLCFYMDMVYVNQEADWAYKMAFAVISIVALLLYVTRVKFMYYLTVPAVLVINVVLSLLWGIEMFYALMIVFILPLPYAAFIVNHPFYFGIGRVRMCDGYRHYPEPLAKKVRARQKADQAASDRQINESRKSRKTERKSSKKQA